MLLKTYSLFAFIMLVISPAIRAGEPVHDWSRRFGDVDNQNAHGAAVDVLGNSIVTGYFAGTVDFGGDALTSAGGTDIFVARFYPDGTHRGSRRFGDGGDQYAYSAAVDDVGYVIVTGYFADTVDFGGDTLTSAGGTDIFVARFNPLGVSHDWSKRFGDSADQRGMGVTIDGSRNVFVTGYFKGTVDFGGGPLTSAGSWDIFVAKFDFGGTHLWSRRFGDTYDQYAYEPAVDNSGNVIVILHGHGGLWRRRTGCEHL
jgi:hypothetical protein